MIFLNRTGLIGGYGLSGNSQMQNSGELTVG
jgi:hypothetical protein